jgi:hypothetical protein
VVFEVVMRVGVWVPLVFDCFIVKTYLNFLSVIKKSVFFVLK